MSDSREAASTKNQEQRTKNSRAAADVVGASGSYFNLNSELQLQKPCCDPQQGFLCLKYRAGWQTLIIQHP